MDGRLAERQSVSGWRQLLDRGVRGHSLYPAAGAAKARRIVGPLSQHLRLVGAHARSALGQGSDLRSHVGGRLGSIQESRTRSMAQSADVTDGSVSQQNEIERQEKTNAQTALHRGKRKNLPYARIDRI